jgi:chondroitin sulfate synthase
MVVPVAMLSAARRRRGIQTTLGVLVGLATGILFTSRLRIGLVPVSDGGGDANGTCSGPGKPWPLPPHTENSLRDGYDDDALRITGMTVPSESVRDSRKALLFVGVMTAQKYLATRARAVYETWGREIPGRIAFFTSATSVPPSNRPDLPLVRLRGVDDSYPPQKKSFLMLQYMWERYGDRFEWFMRADDDVYVRPNR